MNTSLKILHACNETLSIVGLKAVLTKGGGIDEIDNAYSATDVTKKLQEKQYDVVILDTENQEPFVQLNVQTTKQKYPNIAFLVITTGEHHEKVSKILDLEVNGCVTKGCSENEILNAVFSIAKGDKFFCNKVIDVVLQKHLYQNQKEENCDPTSLTQREIEITKLIVEGFTSNDIAEKLFLSTHTIHTHRKNIMRKLGVKSSSELVKYAITVGIING